MTGTQIERERHSDTRMVVSAIIQRNSPSIWLLLLVLSPEVAIERLGSSRSAHRRRMLNSVSTTSWALWKFAQITSSKVSKRRRSGIWEQRLLITKPTREPWPSLTSTRVNQCLISSSRPGNTERAADSAPTQSGRMTDTTPPSTLIPTDTITLTSPTWSTRTSSEVPLETKMPESKSTISPPSSDPQRLNWTTISPRDQKARVPLAQPPLQNLTELGDEDKSWLSLAPSGSAGYLN